MSQIALPLVWPADLGRDGFLVTDCNARAAQVLEHWDNWPVMTGLLTGPSRSGRSLLAHIFAAKTGGTVIDDADRMDEAVVFHAWNAAQAARRPLLLVALPGWTVALPDLRSRLAASPHAAIEPPDDAMIAALLSHGFHRRGLDARQDLVEWLSSRLERNYAAIDRAVDALDRLVMERRKRLSIPFARIALVEAGLIAAPSQEDR